MSLSFSLFFWRGGWNANGPIIITKKALAIQPKKRIRFENTPHRSPNIRICNLIPHRGRSCRQKAESQVSSASVSSWLLLYYYDTSHWKNVFLTWWPWPLTYDLDLRTWPRYPSTWPSCKNSGPYVCPFTCESETHRPTDGQIVSKLLHPLLTRGVIMWFNWSKEHLA